MTSSGILKGSKPKEKLPSDGSSMLFHDFSSTLRPFLTSVLIFIVSRKALEGSSKLSHKLLAPSSPLLRTRFPESKSWAVVALGTKFVIFDDQRISAFPLETTRLPSSDMLRIPEESLRGLFLFATHTTVCTGI
ncbi:hypothetical protein V6Z11_D01G034000 [Gossypium hirsutum]